MAIRSASEEQVDNLYDEFYRLLRTVVKHEEVYQEEVYQEEVARHPRRKQAYDNQKENTSAAFEKYAKLEETKKQSMKTGRRRSNICEPTR
ncbi:hypothetical protein G6011_05189 [Alternaria panax]|uniref:Uncharacterized protein n=1 Tax=Alternaria panax TaxID=48097 RepID=A0AAD4I6B0_9PLEO|nr:hypothetical protein G6011_05189 [Alternaria panax]